ncbi:MAG: DUF1501 domain-containing protein [Chromatiales bacterium]|nr:DUF1501 domain-containing protein [Chromatiales bacterium]
MRKTNRSRRMFLSRCAGLGAAAAGFGWGGFPRAARAAVSDYKALVCVQLLGGNDGNNVIVPVDSGRYSAYQAMRGGLTLSGSELLDPIADALGNPYALHYGLTEIHDLYESGRVAFVLNTGMLHGPLTRAQYLAGQNSPSNLFSHSDQTVQIQTGTPVPDGRGWGGRLLDLFAVGDSLAAVSVSSPSLLLQGANIAPNIVPPGSDLGIWGMGLWPQSAAAARRSALEQIASMGSSDPIVARANATLADGVALSDTLTSGAALPALSTDLPATSIGNQLKEVLRLIRSRSAAGPGRQVFYCTLEGFDTHGGQDWQHWSLLSQLSQAVAAFHESTVEAGLSDQVVLFTQSEFGRTLQPSGSGCDHGWGSHHFVVGDAVQGGIYGQMPTFALGGPDDANNRGVWIPTIGTAQYGATLGRWFGASDLALESVFPNLSAFHASTYGTDVGFMG